MSRSERSGGDCARALASLYEFLDSEVDHASRAEIQHHIEACEPCLDEFQLERMVRVLVARSCCERAPQPLRDKVLLSIRQVHIQITETD
jgi:mycothiol system anti-sigma-R factor